MNKLIIPYHLAIPAVLCLLGLAIIFVKRKKLFTKDRDQLFWISLSLFCAVYGVIVGYAAVMDIYYQIDLNSYDLNKDGIFGADEQSPQQLAALQHVTRDVERNYAVISGLIYGIIVAVPLWLIGTSFKKRKQLK